ncbi:MAG TPA: class I tRNA ligase family protein [Candidatus Paceibacterota bacterium]|nr:class I tRNA ligase family protein [Candidatus Paceibacterota bacterium]
MEAYNPKKIEEKWQKEWEDSSLYEADEKSKKPKSYVLDMFPYPSGDGLHVGHVEGYTASDIYARFLRMKGKNVLHPIGWDAFGLPAENYAIKTKVHPRETTEKAIENFTRQIKSLGLSYDWSREIGTHRPEYFKWTQWFFLFLYKNGLAYKKKAKVNWCPSCQTVLANEQVVNGLCERCKTEVVQKDLEQWFFKITEYAEQLLNGLEKIDWPESTKTHQRNWIGKSEGAEIDFPVDKKYHYVLLHGYKSSPKMNFHPWLKKELESRGHTVEALELPNSQDPDVAEQVEYVLKKVTFDENTIVLAHSLGSAVAAKAIESTGVKIHKLIFVSGFLLDTDPNRVEKYVKTAPFTCDYEKVKENVGSILYLYDKNDAFVDENMAKRTSEVLGAEMVQVEAKQSHFVAKEEPEVLKYAIESVRVFTTRPDTLFGATYLVLAPEHPLLAGLKETVQNWKEVEKYVEMAKGKTELERTKEGKEKTGVKLEGVEAKNPATGENIPIYVADYVLSQYGTGAIMAVPAHDERDFEFAQKYDISVKTVVEAPEDRTENASKDEKKISEVYSEPGVLVHSGKFDGMKSEEAKAAIAEFVGGKMKTTYKLRDWLVSRQRYWGAPIPIIYCEKCGAVPVPEKDLPVLLPDDVDFMPTGESPLAKSKTFHDVICPECGGAARRESDTMDTFVCSSWYYYRFADPRNEKEFASKKEIKKWLPVDLYMGGAEHTVLHLLYARFFTKVLHEHGYTDFDEPFQKLRHQGLILADDGRKMSKSLGNVVNPDEVVGTYGADTLRTYEMFMGPIEVSKPWNDGNIIGARRFLERVWRQAEKVTDTGEEGEEFSQILHRTIKKVTSDIENFSFNTAISQLMICANTMEQMEAIRSEDWRVFLRLLAPFAPFISEELWRGTPEMDSVHVASWPEYDEAKVREEKRRIAVQVNGKVRGTIEIDGDTEEKDALEQALQLPEIQRHLEGKTVKKTIFVPGKILNIVVG